MLHIKGHVVTQPENTGMSPHVFFGFNPKSVIRFHFVSFLSPVYCDHFGEGIAGYVETEREARQRRERRNGGKDRIIITEHHRISV